MSVDQGRPEVSADSQNVAFGRVGMWRGGCRSNISVAASFVWRCLTGSAMAPFPHPAHRYGRGLARRFRPKFGFPVVSPFRLRVSHYLDHATSPAPSPSRISLPRKGCRVGLRIVRFEACPAFTRVTACTLALSPIRDTLTEGFSHFVSSMTAPVASGWSGCRVAFSRRTPVSDIGPDPPEPGVANSRSLPGL
jgi:hypothetical protein